MDRLLATEWKPGHDRQVGLLRLLKSEGLL
jgi:hypothetical protein